MKNKTGQPNSAAARDIAYHLHPTTNIKQHLERGPLIISRGDGVHVFDIDGRSYIEGFAGLWCASLGFSEKRVIAAATAEMNRLPFYHGMFSRSHEASIDLAEKLITLA
ncbi:MAG: aminotransferase class III-fold pyridoxal phosphate-dependent enzyme, partial [Pseudomonadales bacterium]